MYDPQIIRQSFMGLAGVRQNDNPSFPQLASTLLYTGSNVLIDHPLVNIENIDMCARNYAKFTYPAYAPATNYGIDTPQTLVRVTYSSKVYRSKVTPNTGNQPDISPAFWEEVNLLSSFLEDLFMVSIEDTVNRVFLKKKIEGQTKTVLRTIRLYEGGGNMNDLIIGDGSLVGLKVTLKYNQNIVGVVEKIGLQLSAAQNGLTLRLYHSSSIEPIATVNVNHTKAITFEWHTIANFKMQYNNPSHEPGGCFFIMYDQTQLVGQAVKKRHNFSLSDCQTCNAESAIRIFNLYSKYVVVQAVRVSAANRNGTNLWDIEKTEYTPDNNWGMNLELSVKCDLTDFLIQQKNVFAYAIRDMITFKLLTMMANSTRQNLNQAKLDQMARAELQAKYVGGMGFTEQLEKQLAGVNIEISDLDSTCMPCDNSTGLSQGTFSLQR